jgi:hypothetical protein
LPAGGWDPAETRKIADRLIELLPRRATPRSDEPQSGSGGKARPPAVIVLLVVALGVVLLFNVLANGAPSWDDPGVPTGLTNGVRSSAQP